MQCSGRWSWGGAEAAAVALLVIAHAAGCRAPGAVLQPQDGESPTTVRGDVSSGRLPAGYRAPPTSVQRNLAYGPAPAQRVDLHLPRRAAPAAAHPVIVFVHGGGWTGGTRTAVPEWVLRQVDRARFAVASIDYHLVGPDPDGGAPTAHPSPAHDVDRAVRWLRQQASSLALDADRILLVGVSAGAHLALLHAVAPGMHADPALPGELAAVSPHIDGIVSVMGISDLVTFAGSDLGARMTASLLDCPRSEDVGSCALQRLHSASPLHARQPGLRPGYFVYGRDDPLVPPDSQGAPLAAAWLTERGHDGSVRYDVVRAGHDIDHRSMDVGVVERWIDSVAAGRWD